MHPSTSSCQSLLRPIKPPHTQLTRSLNPLLPPLLFLLLVLLMLLGSQRCLPTSSEPSPTSPSPSSETPASSEKP